MHLFSQAFLLVFLPVKEQFPEQSGLGALNPLILGQCHWVATGRGLALILGPKVAQRLRLRGMAGARCET